MACPLKGGENDHVFTRCVLQTIWKRPPGRAAKPVKIPGSALCFSVPLKRLQSGGRSMAKKKRRKDGLYSAQFRYNGKRYTVYSKNISGLDLAKAQKIKELEEGKEQYVNPTLYAYYKEFQAVRRHEVKESTIRAQAVQFKAIAGTEIVKGMLFGDMLIREITRRDIEKVRELMLRAGKTPQYLNNCFAHLNHVFNAAVLDDTILKNPCKGLKQLKRDAPPIGENRHRALSTEETEKFFKVAEKRKSCYFHDFEVMIKTGLRIGELSALYPKDIDRKSGFIHVRRTVIRNEAGGYEVGDDVKTESGRRDIPLTEDVFQAITSQREMNMFLYGNTGADGLLFRSAAGKILREYQINREIKRICQDARIDTFTCHAFRNTFATRFIEQQPQDYKILSEILGHKDVSITLNLYTHVMTENKVRAMNSINIKTS